MIGVSTKFPVFSNFTLGNQSRKEKISKVCFFQIAYFDDTGFYITNRSNAQVLHYGLNLGCSFLTDCDSWPSDLYRCRTGLFFFENKIVFHFFEFSVFVGEQSCTYDRLSIADCQLLTPAKPDPFNYGSDHVRFEFAFVPNF